MRSGLIVKKVGMTRLYLEDGTHVPVTVLSLKDCQVIANQSLDKNGYNSITLATGEAKPKNTNKSQREAFAKIKVTPKQKQMEFRVSEDNMLPIGSELGANHFVVGQYVDATGITIGKGFAGAMKRHNFGGLRASHGVSISHRSHGSTGNSKDPGRVFKGKKMAGQMGNRQRTIQNLQVVAADEDRGLIFIKGGLPGSKGSWISLKDAVKKALPSDAPYPAGLKGVNNTKNEDDKSNQIENKHVMSLIENLCRFQFEYIFCYTDSNNNTYRVTEKHINDFLKKYHKSITVKMFRTWSANYMLLRSILDYPLPEDSKEANKNIREIQSVILERLFRKISLMSFFTKMAVRPKRLSHPNRICCASFLTTCNPASRYILRLK